MQFDRLNKKIKEAADQYNLNYNEEAWVKMEKLLDEHLPQKKNKRKLIPLMLMLFLFISTSGVFLILHRPLNIVNSHKLIKQKNATKLNITNPAVVFYEQNNKSRLQNILAKSSSANKSPVNQTGLLRNNLIAKSSSQKVIDIDKSKVLQNDFFLPRVKPFTVYNDDFFEKEAVVQSGDLISTEIPEQNKENSSASSQQKTENISKQNTAIAKNKFKGYIAFNLSAGPDVSAADLDEIGKTNIFFGAGITYQFHKNWNIRTGFYAVRKIYEADPSNYHPPASFWNNYPNLEDIDANCKVYEIPLIIDYKFGNSKSHNWFTSAGFSSYLMKKEVYDYGTKTVTGQNQYSRFTIRNQNNHFLSSLRLSAGYEKKINRKFFVSTEPYFNLPISGVGYGKVKLKSAGILFTLGVIPFKE